MAEISSIITPVKAAPRFTPLVSSATASSHVSGLLGQHDASRGVTKHFADARVCKSETVAANKSGESPTLQVAPGRSVRGERANFARLVLGCIEAKFCKKICVGISYLFEKKIEKRDMGRD